MKPGLIIDNFAGGGGASTGIEQALGRAIDVAINHDPEAIAMHKANHPDTHHYCQSVWKADPLDVTGGKHVSLCWFSPDCKHFSKAKGGQPRAKHIRDLAWVVVMWAQRVKPDVIMLENVEEFRGWGPLDEEGNVIRERAGETFEKWTKALRRAGYQIQWRELRACDYGAPTSRKRFFMIARSDGQPIVWPEPTHGKPGTPGVESGKLLPWRTAAEIIDWTIPCPSIFERVRPLKDATCRRIAAGIVRFVLNNPRPFIVPITHTKGGPFAHDSNEPLRTVTTAKGGEFAVVGPSIVPLTHHGGDGRVYDPEAPIPTVTGAHRGEMAMVSPVIVGCGGRRGQSGPVGPEQPFPTTTAKADAILVAPYFARTAHGEVDSKGKKRGKGQHTAEEPHPTVTQSRDSALIAASLVRHFGASLAADIDYPVATITAGGSGKTGLVVALLSKFAENSIGILPTWPLHTGMAGAPRHAVVRAHLSHQYTSNTNGGRGDPRLPHKTITTGGHHAVVATTMVQIGYGEREGQAPRALDIEAPLGTVVAGGAKHAAVAAFLHKYHAGNVGGSLTDPMPTITANSFIKRPGGAVPLAVTAIHLEQANGGPRNLNLAGRRADDPISTVTSKGSQQRLVASNLVKLQNNQAAKPLDEPLDTILAGGMHYGEVRAFLTKYYGNEHGAHSVETPIGTVTTKERFGLVTVTIDGEEYAIADIGMRMLAPRELFAAQGFPPDYEIECREENGGKPLTKTSQIAKCGNSVCPDLSRALVAANFAQAQRRYVGEAFAA